MQSSREPSPTCLNAVLMARPTTLSCGAQFAGQFVNSCTRSARILTVRARRLFDFRTSNVAGSLE